MSGSNNLESLIPAPDSHKPFSVEIIEHSLQELLQDSFERHADRVAIESGNKKISYRELDRLTNQLANEIISVLGDKPEPVAVLVEQGISQIIAIVGILKSGKTYAVFDLVNPPERLARMLADFGARLIISNSNNFALAKRVSDEHVSVVELDKVNTSDKKTLVCRSAYDVAGVYFTSGSTGQPKGVVQTHRSLLHWIMTVTNLYGMNSDDRQTLAFSCSFSSSVHPLFCTLLCGGTLCLVNLKSMSMRELSEYIEKERITILQLSPSILRSLMESLNKNERSFPGLRIVIAGGEPLQSQDARQWQTLFSCHTVLGCSFASSEAGYIAFNAIRFDTKIPQGIVPAGSALPQKEILIVDEERHPLPKGEAGEIAIRSEFLANGYLNKPGLTETGFRNDPDDPSKRIYYSNDLGRILPDGKLMHLGRKDNYAKIRGYSVDLTEVEQMIYELNNVQHAAVVVVESDDPDRKHLVAYMVLKPEVERDPSVLRKKLAEKLPAYMIPSFFVFLDQMPLNSNGKADKKLLPPFRFDRNLQIKDQPANDVERRLLSVWRDTLKVKPIGVTDNFFDIGGDSLLAINLLLSIEKEFSRKMPLTIILNASTIRQQAEVISNKREIKAESLIPVKLSGKKPPLFWIPSGFGADLYVQGMAKHLDGDQPLYLLAVPDSPKEQIIMVEELAKIYAKQIQEFYPDGPYYLVGHSGGGMVACATAEELRRAGGRIGWVGMLDTVSPNGSKGSIFKSFRLFIRNIDALGFVRSLKDLYRNIFVATSALILKIPWIESDILRTRKIPIVKMLGVRESGYVKVFFVHRFYIPKPFRFDLIVFRATGTYRYNMEDRTLGWDRFAANGLKYVDVPGDHVSMMEEPNITVLAKKICEQVST